jgi:hypothetical protein
VPPSHPQGLQGLLLGAAILSSYELAETFETYSPRYQPSSHIPLDSKWLPMELRTVVFNRSGVEPSKPEPGDLIGQNEKEADHKFLIPWKHEATGSREGLSEQAC